MKLSDRLQAARHDGALPQQPAGGVSVPPPAGRTPARALPSSAPEPPRVVVPEPPRVVAPEPPRVVVPEPPRVVAPTSPTPARGLPFSAESAQPVRVSPTPARGLTFASAEPPRTSGSTSPMPSRGVSPSAEPAVAGVPASPTTTRILPFSASSAEPAEPASLSARSNQQLHGPTADPLARLKEQAATTLFERLGARLSDPDVDEAALHAMVRAELNAIVDSSSTPLTHPERRRLTQQVLDHVLGLGELEPLLADNAVTEIMVNGPDQVYVERAGIISLSPVTFDGEPQLRRVIDRIVGLVGRRIDESSPLVDARLEDGSRVNAIIPPLAVSGSTLTIRKFSKDALSVNDLIAKDTLTPEMAELLRACVQARLNIMVTGGTGTGKTTLLNVLSCFIPDTDRIITIEDAVELRLQQQHVVRLEARPANTEGRGEITIRDLVRNSLRMRPDRIVVGEVRGAESLDMLQAMNTGHDGSLSSVHANSPRDSIARLETLVLMAGLDLPLRAVREQIASALDVIVHLARLRDGTRRVVAVTEVHGMEGQTVTLQDIFVFDYSAGVDRDGRFLGHPRATGVRPRFVDRFADLGISLSPEVFGTAEAWQARR